MVRKCVQAGEEASATKCDEKMSERMRGMHKEKIGARAASQKVELHFGSDHNIRNEDFGGKIGEC